MKYSTCYFCVLDACVLVVVTHGGSSSLLVPLRIRAGDTELAMFSTATVFGTPRDVTLAEIAIESFYPSDHETAEFFRSVG